jgi:two-component system chemotaxis response regulator CheY
MRDELAALQLLKFLVVDDDNSIRKIITYELKKIGVLKITEASNGPNAWTALEKSIGNNSFDIVISDWNMPIMSGLELLRKCRAHSEFKQLAFMLVTSESEMPQVKEAIEAGVDGYLVKPVKTKMFEEKLIAVYNKRFAKRPS